MIEGLEIEEIGQSELGLVIPEAKPRQKGACQQSPICPFPADRVCMRCGKHICAGHQRAYHGIPIPFCESCRPNAWEAARMRRAYYSGVNCEFAGDQERETQWLKTAPDWMKRIRREGPI